ncbi:MAG TPA: hypothetical protein VMK12_15580 [Anaeromyxobacteraceae bacterium]|nr:hypothetical protein [Anaeromyxobacteraceae bacterium]
MPITDSKQRNDTAGAAVAALGAEPSAMSTVAAPANVTATGEVGAAATDEANAARCRPDAVRRNASTKRFRPEMPAPG